MKPLFLVFFCLALVRPSSALSPRVYLRKVLNIVESGDFVKGSQELYRLSRLRAYKRKRAQIKYTLGMMFAEMKLYHIASTQFIYTIKYGRGEYRRKSLEKLGHILQHLGDESLFYYAVSLANFRDFPSSQRDKFYFYQGLTFFKKEDYKRTRRYLSKIRPGSPFYNRAQYHIGLSFAEEDRVRKAERVFRNLALTRGGVTDPVRIAALMGTARTLYQAGRFADSIKVYRSIPKDTSYWHDVLLESGWSYLRIARFRSALSNFQTLHSPFYKDYYQPESLILRAYVYLYICKYYEMEKVLNLFNAVYLPTLKAINRTLNSGTRHKQYFNEVTSAQSAKESGRALVSSDMSPVVLNRIMENAKFKRYLEYLKKLAEEQARLSVLPAEWLNSRVGQNAAYILKSRVETVKKLAGKLVRASLLDMRRDIQRLSRSEQYLRYDMMRGKREFLKKRIAKKYANFRQIDEKAGRDYYIQNGYDYWPFKGENWLDELGNYHYVGLHGCQ